MQNTTNFNLQKPDYNNVADIGVLNGNFDKIDNGLSPFYVATQSGANTYKVITGANKTTLANGYSIRVAIPTPSDGAVSIIVDGCNAVPVKKPNGNAVTNFKANGVYSLTYYNSVFILASGGVDDVNFSASDLLSGKTANNSDGETVTGTMPNIGQQTATINAGGKVTISKGYHDGTGYVQSNSMTTQLTNLGVTLTSANQLVKDVKAVGKSGNLITGTATIQSLGGLIVQQGSGNYTPTYGLNYNGNVETMTLTVPLNLSFTPKVLIITYEIDDYVGNKLVTDVLNSYTNTWTKGVTNYSYGSTSSSETYNHTSATRSISSMPKDSISITATNMNRANVWSFPYNGSVYHPSESNGFTPLPTNVSWTAIG